MTHLPPQTPHFPGFKTQQEAQQNSPQVRVKISFNSAIPNA